MQQHSLLQTKLYIPPIRRELVPRPRLIERLNPTVDVPVYFFQGRYDYSTPGEVVERYYKVLDAPQKSLVWFEQSAHFPQWEEPQEFADELSKILCETE